MSAHFSQISSPDRPVSRAAGWFPAARIPGAADRAGTFSPTVVRRALSTDGAFFEAQADLTSQEKTARVQERLRAGSAGRS